MSTQRQLLRAQAVVPQAHIVPTSAASLPACLPAYLVACLLGCLLTCLLACLPEQGLFFWVNDMYQEFAKVSGIC